MKVLIAEMLESVKLPFLCLRKLGLFSTNKFKAYIPMTILALIAANLVLLGLLQFINIKRDISDIVRNLEDILVFSMATVRLTIVTYRNEDFTRLFQTAKLFWDASKCNQKTKMELIAIRRFTSQLQKLLLSGALICVLLVIIFPLLQNTTPTGIWTMEGHAMLYRFVLIEQIIVIPLCGFVTCSLDCMYLGFCAEIVIQFRILSQTLQELKVEGNAVSEVEMDRLNEIKGCVRHHRIILRFVKEFRQAFSLVLLSEFVLDGPLICAELLAAFESNLMSVSSDKNLESQVTKFWEHENIIEPNPGWFVEQIKYEKHFCENNLRNSDGKFIVKLPFKEDTELDDSRSLALKQFL
ncbi:hypothetical protein ILUMI_11127 [Ignelater luminosus]|uniref:Odorant receptor n=1 Tax=Ignelater luminosus TaxID=2038154 RepID=A0A8K0CWT8_IGNLU|nr:hypothetical protein ILUMI_11127 [Ignelater luminosus]